MKIEKLDENSNNYRRVRGIFSQSPYNKVKTFAIISPENPLGWKKADEEEFIDKYMKYS